MMRWVLARAIFALSLTVALISTAFIIRSRYISYDYVRWSARRPQFHDPVSNALWEVAAVTLADQWLFNFNIDQSTPPARPPFLPYRELHYNTREVDPLHTPFGEAIIDGVADQEF